MTSSKKEKGERRGSVAAQLRKLISPAPWKSWKTNTPLAVLPVPSARSFFSCPLTMGCCRCGRMKGRHCPQTMGGSVAFLALAIIVLAIVMKCPDKHRGGVAVFVAVFVIIALSTRTRSCPCGTVEGYGGIATQYIPLGNLGKSKDSFLIENEILATHDPVLTGGLGTAQAKGAPPPKVGTAVSASELAKSGELATAGSLSKAAKIAGSDGPTM